MRSWDGLTATGRLRRLRRVAEVALAHYPVVVRRIRLVGGFVNAVFRVDTASGPLALRIEQAPEHSDADTANELAWIRSLAQEPSLTVASPRATRSGAWTVRVEVPGIPRARRCTLFGWIGGRPLGDRLDVSSAVLWGQLSAQLHRHGATFRPPTRPMSWDRIFYWPEDVDPVVIDDPAWVARIPAPHLQVIDRARERIAAAFAALPAEGAQVVHGDLHPYNIHRIRDRVVPLDFEDVMWAHPVQDVAISLFYLVDRPDGAALTRAFAAGYTTVAPWPETRAGLIDSFVAARRIMFANYMLHGSDEGLAYLAGAVPKLSRFLDAGS